jgi:hypothetical protein
MESSRPHYHLRHKQEQDMSALRCKQNKQALIKQVLTNTIKIQMNNKYGWQRTRIPKQDINSLMCIGF